jgi:geranylgeranyl pyrophosphate synthase
MTQAPHGKDGDASVEQFLDEVREASAQELARTPLGQLISDFRSLLGSGKMLRSRMAYRLQDVSPVPRPALISACAAVEMVHAASLLHDDVIDGGMVRRGAPTFWIERGISGAILLGDLLLFKALDLVGRTRQDGLWTRALVEFTGEVCEAESEQELVLRGADSSWEDCVRIARRKTGSLFAFVAYVLAGDDERLQATLREAGYMVGTAYQLADDVLDAVGSEQNSGKTLGTDRARNKITAMSAAIADRLDPVEQIEAYCADSLATLRPWPPYRDAWNLYLEADIRPALARLLRSPSVGRAPAV